MNEVKGTFTGERALFARSGIRVSDSVFEDGESPLKECSDIEISHTGFKWKYPLWYCRGVLAENCVFEEMSRAGMWYSENMIVRDSIIHAPKDFRRCRGLRLENVQITHAEETLWSCTDVKLRNVTVNGSYFAMNSSRIEAEGLKVEGGYCFDGARDVTIRNSELITKDAFWNSENVTVYDSYISGEYLGWNSKNLTLIGCTVESLQGMCYIDGLKMISCKLPDTTLAFEYSSVEADIDSYVESVFNPKSGRIRAERIGELIIEPGRVDPEKTEIVCDDIGKRSDRPEWLREKE